MLIILKTHFTSVNIEEIDYQWQTNGEQHLTSRFDLMKNRKGLILRRGQSFLFDVTLSRAYDSKSDGLRFYFTLDGTQKDESITSTQWNVQMTVYNKKLLRISVRF